ncbi:MAG: hypothetical protein ABIH23_29795 [bacterium]
MTVRIPPSFPAEAAAWRILDDSGATVQSGKLSQEISRDIYVGKLGIGWYRIEFLDEDGGCLNWTSAAVLAKLAAPIPQDSPICVDGAVAWFAKDDPANQESMARLAALAGVNWIRDRMKWNEIEPQPDRFAEKTTYDTAADLQAHHGLKILQVFHSVPEWVAEDSSSRGRFPADLRFLYKFCKAMSERYKGRVQAWEPWNEANAHDFGGHTVDEMCTMQKAAYLGFKSGDPEITVGWNAYAGVPTDLHTKGVLANETWPYFDTYNIHTYDWPESYQNLWGPVREAACGRPIWVTESDRGMECQTGEPWCDFSQENEIKKAKFMAQSYVSSLFAGCNRHFHFILGHYTGGRNKIQFGLLRFDQTPRPSYVALAALGRLLAGGKCMGRWRIDGEPYAHVYAFRAKPDGIDRDVLIAWAEKPSDWSRKGITSVAWSIPEEIQVKAIYDYRDIRLTPVTPISCGLG